MQSKRITAKLLLFAVVVFLLSGCKTTEPHKKKHAEHADGKKTVIEEKEEEPKETVKDLMLRIGRNYVIVNKTILEHMIFSGVVELTSDIQKSITKVLLLLTEEEKKGVRSDGPLDEEFKSMLLSLKHEALMLQTAATQSDINKAKQHAVNWQKFSSVFNQ